MEASSSDSTINRANSWAPKPRQQVILAQHALHSQRNRSQYLIRNDMTIGIVYGRKVIHIDHDHRDRSAVTATPRHFAFKRFGQETLVVDTRQSVAGHHRVDRFVVLRVDVVIGQEAKDAGP